jgi:hypothetical protein
MAAPLTVYPDGQRIGILLADTDHLATGGEASVYLKDRRVFKLYCDPQQAVARGIERKLQMLQAIRHPDIATPEGLVFDRHGSLIGLSGPYVPGEPLCRLFTNTWRDAHQIGPAETGRLVDGMRAVVQAAHAAGAVMVDANELNWIADGTRAVVIDVDSWQLPGFPASVVMPSIRDPNHPGFDEGSDWFAWAVVSFQLWTGIHPYKGTHPDHGRGQLEQRMKARASVFDAGMKLPAAARPLQQIPPRLRAWYERTFQSAERQAPPRAADSPVAPQAATTLKLLQTSAGALRLERVHDLAGPVVAAINGFLVVQGPAGAASLWDVVARRDVPVSALSQLPAGLLEGRAALLRRPAATIALELDIHAPGSPVLRATDLGTGTCTTLPVAGQRLWQAHDRVFVLADHDALGLHELDVVPIGEPGAERLVIGVSRRWPAHTRCSTFLRNVFVQDAFGTPVIGVITGDGLHHGSCAALRDHRVIDAFAADVHNVWLSVHRVRDGELLRVRLSLRGGEAHIEHESIVATPDIEAAMTHTGVAVLRDGDELLVTHGDRCRTVPCNGLSPTLRLVSAGSAIFGVERTQVARLSLS